MASLQAGKIVSWESPSKEVDFEQLRRRLTDAGFDSSLAKDMAPRNAFSRSCKELSENRVIDKIEEFDDEIKFQLTKKALRETQLEYSRECDMYLHKDTGNVRGTDPVLASHAETLVRHHLSVRSANDITTLFKRIFKSQRGDLIPIRKQGGVYFVPFTHNELIDRLSVLMETIGGKMRTFNISVSQEDNATRESLAEEISEHLLGLIAEFKESCESVSLSTKKGVLDRRCRSTVELRAKLEAYGSLLSGYTDKIRREIIAAEDELIRRASMDNTIAA